MSEPRYRMLCVAMMLQNHLGFKQNPDFNGDDPYDGSDSRTQFIHAALMDGYPASCCTAPVIYAAVGRRLGYPIKLVKTTSHLFCRWDDPRGERFNIEATNPGFYTHPDEYYCTWPKPIEMAAVRRGIFLRSLSPREELATFLSIRGVCFVENLRPAEALEPLYYSCRLDPNEHFFRCRWMIASVMQRASEEAILRGALDSDASAWRIPPPRKDWEHLIYRQACRDLNRIRSNRRIEYADVPRDLMSEVIVTRT